jgi:hypothetical protein
MSRSKRKTPILGITTAETEASDKVKWHWRHRREERARLDAEGRDYAARSWHQLFCRSSKPANGKNTSASASVLSVSEKLQHLHLIFMQR